MYYSGIKTRLKDKFMSDMYDICESILMLLGSIETINIDNNDEKNNILKRVNPLKHHKTDLETSVILEIVNSTLYNLDLIKEFVDIFKIYIDEMIAKNKRENYHLNNFRVNLESKKDHILLEHKKFYYKLEELVEYFTFCTNEINEQMKHNKLLGFLINKTE